VPSSLGIPGAPFLSAFAYLRPGKPSFCQGPHKTSNFDFRGAKPLLQIYACIKFRGRLPFWAVCESSATKPLVCDVFLQTDMTRISPSCTTLDLRVHDQPCSNKKFSRHPAATALQC
jgi:hypothetical protein